MTNNVTRFLSVLITSSLLINSGPLNAFSQHTPAFAHPLPSLETQALELRSEFNPHHLTAAPTSGMDRRIAALMRVAAHPLTPWLASVAGSFLVHTIVPGSLGWLAIPFLAMASVGRPPKEDVWLGDALLTDDEIRMYLGPLVLQQAWTENRRFYIRRLNPTRDKSFLTEWQKSLAGDVEWRRRFGKPHGYGAPELPFFPYFEPLSFGLVSAVGDQERLEGFFGLNLVVLDFDEQRDRFTQQAFLPQIELRYRNIGERPEVPGVSELLMDYLMKRMHESKTVDHGLIFDVMSPASKGLALRWPVDGSGANKRFVSNRRIMEEVRDRHLADHFNRSLRPLTLEEMERDYAHVISTVKSLLTSYAMRHKDLDRAALYAVVQEGQFLSQTYLRRHGRRNPSLQIAGIREFSKEERQRQSQVNELLLHLFLGNTLPAGLSSLSERIVPIGLEPVVVLLVELIDEEWALPGIDVARKLRLSQYIDPMFKEFEGEGMRWTIVTKKGELGKAVAMVRSGRLTPSPIRNYVREVMLRVMKEFDAEAPLSDSPSSRTRWITLALEILFQRYYSETKGRTDSDTQAMLAKGRAAARLSEISARQEALRRDLQTLVLGPFLLGVWLAGFVEELVLQSLGSRNNLTSLKAALTLIRRLLEASPTLTENDAIAILSRPMRKPTHSPSRKTAQSA